MISSLSQIILNAYQDEALFASFLVEPSRAWYRWNVQKLEEDHFYLTKYFYSTIHSLAQTFYAISTTVGVFCNALFLIYRPQSFQPLDLWISEKGLSEEEKKMRKEIAAPLYKSFYKGEKINSIKLSGKSLTSCFSLDHDFFKDIQTLDLSNNFLKDCPQGLEKLNRLTSLDLSDNQIQELDGPFPDSLIWIDLSRNQMKKLSASLGNLPNLKTLNVAYNQIDTFPEGTYSSLEKLWLNDNEINEFVQEKFLKLDFLDLRNNSMSHLSCDQLFQKSLQLKYIGLCGCKFLSSLPSSFFSEKKNCLSLIQGSSLSILAGEKATLRSQRHIFLQDDSTLSLSETDFFKRIRKMQEKPQLFHLSEKFSSLDFSKYESLVKSRLFRIFFPDLILNLDYGKPFLEKRQPYSSLYIPIWNKTIYSLLILEAADQFCESIKTEGVTAEVLYNFAFLPFSALRAIEEIADEKMRTVKKIDNFDIYFSCFYQLYQEGAFPNFGFEKGFLKKEESFYDHCFKVMNSSEVEEFRKKFREKISNPSAVQWCLDTFFGSEKLQQLNEEMARICSNAKWKKSLLLGIKEIIKSNLDKSSHTFSSGSYSKE